jgi:hypothetical protein
MAVDKLSWLIQLRIITTSTANGFSILSYTLNLKKTAAGRWSFRGTAAVHTLLLLSLNLKKCRINYGNSMTFAAYDWFEKLKLGKTPLVQKTYSPQKTWCVGL